MRSMSARGVDWDCVPERCFYNVNRRGMKTISAQRSFVDDGERVGHVLVLLYRNVGY